MAEIFTKPVLTFISLLVIFLIRISLRSSAVRFSRKRNISETQKNSIHRAIDLAIVMLILTSLVTIWGVDTENIYVFITSILALVAIGFVAVWSILSNVFAGVLLYFNKPFIKGSNTIEIIPDNIEGKVKDITLLHTLIQDKKGNIYQIPNNMIFQKIVKIKPKDKL